MGVPAYRGGMGNDPGRLRRHGESGDLPVIIEKTGGLVVDRVLAAGHPVVPVHRPLYAARPRWGASDAKSDGFARR